MVIDTRPLACVQEHTKALVPDISAHLILNKTLYNCKFLLTTHLGYSFSHIHMQLSRESMKNDSWLVQMEIQAVSSVTSTSQA